MRGMESDYGNTDSDPSKHYVQFYKKAKQDKAATLEQGRPIFKMVDYIRIHTPGQKDSIIDTPVNDAHRRTYARQFEAFLADKSQDEASGTLLSAWGGVSPERVEEYAYGKIRTVEQLAGASDSALQNMGPGSTKERQRARDYVELMKGNAPLAKMRADLEARDEQITAMERQLKEQAEAIAELRGLKTKSKKAE